MNKNCKQLKKKINQIVFHRKRKLNYQFFLSNFIDKFRPA